MRLYISGPMRGIPDNNSPAFDAAAKLLRSVGYEVVNPAEISRGMAKRRGVSLSEISDKEYILVDLVAVAECDAIVLLDGWESSRGAAVEIALAKYLQLPIYVSVAALLKEAA